MKLTTTKREFEEIVELAKKVKEKNSVSYKNQIENINLHLKELFKQIKILSLNKVILKIIYLITVMFDLGPK